MPFESQAQEGYMHEHPEVLGKKALAEWDAATKGKHLPEHAHHRENPGESHMAEKHKKHGRHHPYDTTTMHHHRDGSITMKHHHESGDPKKHIEHALPDLDAAHDSMEEHLGEPNQGESEAIQAGAAGGAGGGMAAGAGAGGGV
jgi:hypothetical protein